MASTPTFQLYNTLTRRVDPIEPAEQTADGTPHLRFYSCGPTVYAFAHIGNFRSFLTADLIVRTARALGWDTTYVTNVTDVGHLTDDDMTDPSGEDRMVKALRSKEGQRFANIWDLARYYTEALLRDWRALNLQEPDVRPRATEHIRPQILAVQQLIENGHAYETSQGIYFSVESFPDYGKLSGRGQDAEALVEGAAAQSRDVVTDPDKRDPRDFALWKKDDAHLMQWHSPWGWGFPGWHIECSVMANEYLGPSIDLHAGGEDLIFPHHECEIAQAESLSGEPFARYWAHTRFLQVEGEKMSKSKGNFYTVRDFIAPEPEGRDLDPLALRLTLLSGQYRKPFNFTFDTLRDNVRHVQRLQDVDALVDDAMAEDAPGDDFLGERLDALYDKALAALCDDLNTPAAIAAALEGAKMLGGVGSNLNGATARRAKDWLDQINALLGIIRHDETPASADDPEEEGLDVQALIDERDAARAAKDYERADALRDALQEMGYEVMDTPEGTQVRRQVRI
ncbi:MAG: cysteine--tRNA ligase [Bacteroidetes bacterium]|jgi:cysteinyl-tRNA synthetase|nr:cysteine--tRNA ligase [Bacteroidota bacterium]